MNAEREWKTNMKQKGGREEGKKDTEGGVPRLQEGDGHKGEVIVWFSTWRALIVCILSHCNVLVAREGLKFRKKKKKSRSAFMF